MMQWNAGSANGGLMLDLLVSLAFSASQDVFEFLLGFATKWFDGVMKLCLSIRFMSRFTKKISFIRRINEYFKHKPA